MVLVLVLALVVVVVMIVGIAIVMMMTVRVVPGRWCLRVRGGRRRRGLVAAVAY